ncbi:MAG: hypothetical protein QXK06_04650 [Candidatus Diapherotrites archaeon]
MNKKICFVLLALTALLFLPAVLAEETTPTQEPTETPEITPTPQETPVPEVTATPEETPASTPMPEEGTDPETGEPIVDEETSQEIQAINSGYGAQVRLLQLEKAVVRAIARGEAIVSFIKEKFPEKDTSGLEAILKEFEALKEEIKTEYESVKANGVDEDTVKTFVDLKKDARSLAKQFRDTVRELLKGNEKQGLAQYLNEKLKETDNQEIEELNSKIRENAQKFNAERLEAFFAKLEQKAPELVAKVRNGEISLAEAKAQLREIMKGLDPIPKGKAFQWMKEVTARERVFGQAKALEAQKNFLERRMNRLQERIEWMKKNEEAGEAAKKIMERVQERIQNRITDQNLLAGRMLSKNKPNGKPSGAGGR